MPMPDVYGKVPPPPLSTASSSSDPSSSATWTPPNVSVGNSIQTNDQDSSQAPPTSGPVTRRNDLFGSVDSSLGSSRPQSSSAENDQLQREEQDDVRRPPPGGWKEKRQLQAVVNSGDGSTAFNRPILSGEDGDGSQA